MEHDELERRISELFSAPPVVHTDGGGGLVSWGIDARMVPVLREWVRPGSVTLETGAGISTILFLLLGAVHRSITPDAREIGRIIDYCDRHGIPTTNYYPIVGSSERVLPGLGPEITLDFALIDGNHAFPAPQIDWYYLTSHLQTKGVIAVDDVALWPCRILVDFLDEDDVWQRLTRNDRFAVYRMTAPRDEVLRRWWGQQPFVVRHSPAVMPASGNSQGTVPKRALGKPEGRSSPAQTSPAGRSQPKLTVAVPFPVYPPVGGGQQRVFSLYRHVARDFDVELVTLAESDAQFSERDIAPGMREIRVPKSAQHQAEEARLMQEVGGVPVGDIGIHRFVAHTPEYGRHLARSAATAALVVASHPYSLPAMRQALGDRPLVYEAHNVEYLLKKAVLGHFGATGAGLVETVRELEAEACHKSRLILCCSADDRDELCRLYGVESDRVVIVPNGVDTEAVPFTPPGARRHRKAAFGLDGQRLALFVGSWHPPNLEAAEALFRIAAATPGVKFLLVGSQCLPLADRPRPANVGLMGVVDEETLTVLLALADVALNPMLGGSGTNLKLATYLAAGVPVITTPVGARGYALVDGSHAVICGVKDFPDAIARVVNDETLAGRLATRGRRLVEQRYDWAAIASGVVSAVRSVLHLPVPSADPVAALIHGVSRSIAEIGSRDDQELVQQVSVALTDMGFSESRPAPDPRVAELRGLADSVPYWFHSIDLGHGVVTRGVKSADMLASELKSLELPDLRGKTVLDIGAWDGFFSFQAERLGAARVVSLDHFMWAEDPAVSRYYQDCRESGVPPESGHVRCPAPAADLPGKRGYDIAARVFNSKAEAIVDDFMTMDLDALGRFDVVLYLGVLYHMQDPLAALRRLAAVARELVVIESEAVVVPGYEHLAICRFYEGGELNQDASNWWAPNQRALEGMCRAAGFARVNTLVGPPAEATPGSLTVDGRPSPVNYRTVVHAWK